MNPRRSSTHSTRRGPRVREILTLAPVTLLGLDRRGVVTLHEGRGLGPEGRGGLVGQPASEACRGVPGLRESIERALAGEPVAARLEADGRLYQARFQPTRDAGGAVSGAIGVVADVTPDAGSEVERAEPLPRDDDAASAAGARGTDAARRLAGGAGHDFNNLLTVILGNAQLLLESVPLDGPQRESVLEIRRAGERAARLARDLLAYARGVEESPEPPRPGKTPGRPGPT